MQRGGFPSERDAAESLDRALDRVRRANGIGSTLTLAALVDEYLSQHDAQHETIDIFPGSSLTHMGNASSSLPAIR